MGPGANMVVILRHFFAPGGETMTSAATIGPTAAIDAAMELGSPALFMRLGGGVMHMFAFVAWACYRYPTPGGAWTKLRNALQQPPSTGA